MNDDSPQDTCWICLSSDSDHAQGIPERLCQCPVSRVAHRRCLAKWQLISAGRSEEHACRFCKAIYPSWKDSFPVPGDKSYGPAIPVVSVHYNGVCYRIRVKPGPDGFANFQRQLQRITGLPVLDCMQITFQCKAPDTAQELNFIGISAFDAAIHCASISAAERMASMTKEQSTSPSDSHNVASDSVRGLLPTTSVTTRTPSQTAQPQVPRTRSLDGVVAQPASAMRAITEVFRQSVDVANPIDPSRPPVVEHVMVMQSDETASASGKKRGLGRIKEFFRSLWC